MALTQSTTDPDTRAQELEAKMTDDERFSLIISVLCYVPGSVTGASGGRDPRIPPDPAGTKPIAGRAVQKEAAEREAGQCREYPTPVTGLCHCVPPGQTGSPPVLRVELSGR